MDQFSGSETKVSRSAIILEISAHFYLVMRRSEIFAAGKVLHGSLAKSINRYQSVLYSGVRKRLERDIAVGNHGTPWVVSKIDKSILKRNMFGRTKRTWARYYWRYRVTPWVVSKIDQSILKRIMFGRTKRTGARYLLQGIVSLPGSLAKSINRYQNVLCAGVRKGLEREIAYEQCPRTS